MTETIGGALYSGKERFLVGLALTKKETHKLFPQGVPRGKEVVKVSTTFFERFLKNKHIKCECRSMEGTKVIYVIGLSVMEREDWEKCLKGLPDGCSMIVI